MTSAACSAVGLGTVLVVDAFLVMMARGTCQPLACLEAPFLLFSFFPFSAIFASYFCDLYHALVAAFQVDLSLLSPCLQGI